MTKIRNRWSNAVAIIAILLIAWQGWVLDTNRQQKIEAQQAQEEESKRLQLIIYSAPVAIILCGPDRTIKLCNPKAGEMFGWDHEELVGQRIETLMPYAVRDEHALRFFDAVKRMRLHEKDWLRTKFGIKADARHKDGTHFPVIVSVRLIKYNDKIEVVSSMRYADGEVGGTEVPIPQNPIQQRR